jgi:hypothetical protein
MVRPRGANLTFEPPFVASFHSNAKFKSSRKFMKLLVVHLSPALSMGSRPGRMPQSRRRHFLDVSVFPFS